LSESGSRCGCTDESDGERQRFHIRNPHKSNWMGPMREPQCVRGAVDEKDSHLALADWWCAHEKIFIRLSFPVPMFHGRFGNMS
jgi:hypothetical protein